MCGLLTSPPGYRSRLYGAIFEVHFELTHLLMRGKNENEEPGLDTYMAGVSALHVLVPPKPTCVTPTRVTPKRNGLGKLDLMESPMEKSRISYLPLTTTPLLPLYGPRYLNALNTLITAFQSRSFTFTINFIDTYIML